MKINGPSEDEIRARAYELYIARKRKPGHDLDDWLQAEFELTHLPLRVVHLKPIKARKGLRRRRARWFARSLDQ